jgi:hypothetical protein
MYYVSIGGPCSVFAKTAGYELDGPGSNPCVGEFIRTCPDRLWSPPSLLYNGNRVFLGGKELSECDVNTSPPSSAVGHE